MPETNEAQSTLLPDAVPVESVHQFAALIGAWHSRKVAILEHMLQVPDGTEVELGMPDGSAKKFVVAGEFKEGLLVGINLTLMELGILPFAASEDTPTTVADATIPG